MKKYVPLFCDAERNRSADMDRNSVRKFRKPLLTFSNLLFLFSDFDSGIGSEGAKDTASEQASDTVDLRSPDIEWAELDLESLFLNLKKSRLARPLDLTGTS